MRNITAVLALSAIAAAGASCGDVVRNGRSPVYLVVDSLQGSRGGSTPGPFGTGLLDSDVITNITTPAPCTSTSPCPTVFGDTGQVSLRISPKDIGAGGNPASPTPNNEVTITRYHVEYTRTDGRNVQGVDVPYAFDGGTTGTVSTSAATLGFELVRNIAKSQTPLIQLQTNSAILEAIATVTFYGHDQVGNELSVSGTISIEFANFGD
jgi:hypothetical protein